MRDELDFIASLQGDDRLLVVGTDTRTTLTALLVLAAIILDVYAANGDFESLLNGFCNRMLVGRFENFEGVLTKLRAELVGFLRETDELKYAVGLH